MVIHLVFVDLVVQGPIRAVISVFFLFVGAPVPVHGYLAHVIDAIQEH